MGKEIVPLQNGITLNGTEIPEDINSSNIADIIEFNEVENFFISPVGCAGILRRKNERNLNINKRLEQILITISSQWSDDDIQKVSLIQPRGAYSRIAI